MVKSKVKRLASQSISKVMKRSSHKGEIINNWSSAKMENALREYLLQKDKPTDQQLTIRKIANSWDVPYSKF